ncbi:MAG: hypothetical protein ACWA5W_07145 [Phycisphaerales bacterium]
MTIALSKALTRDTAMNTHRALQLSSIAALLAFSGMAGCSRSDDAQAAVKQAGRSFNSVALGDPNTAQSFSSTTYKETEQLVSQYAGSDNGYTEGAAVSVALAKLGQASLASQQASKMETEALHKARVIRGLLNEWFTMNAIAQGASQFDGSNELTEITKLISLREDDVKQYQAQRAQVDAEIAQYDEQIADLHAQSNAERNKSGELELQMPRVSAAQAAEIVVRVREHTLRADNFELEANRLEGIVGQLRPGAREIDLNVSKAQAQIELLNSAREELKERERSSRADAQQAAQAADTAASAIAQAVKDYASFRSSDVRDANDSAISLARAAVGALRDAKGPIKQVASLTKASIEQTLAECNARQAAGYREAAILYNALAESGLPGDWLTQAKAATDAQQEATQATNDAYQETASALRGARIRGEDGEKLEATAQRLDLLGGVEPEPEYDEDLNADSDGYDESDVYDDSGDEMTDENLSDD